MMKKQITTNSEKETIETGYNFAKMLEPGDLVLIYGDLGAGKTEFCKGICEYFEVEATITSPTFTIINQYSGISDEIDLIIFHIDLYRIKTQKEIDEIGLNEFIFDEFSIKLVEWPDNNFYNYPENALEVSIELHPTNQNVRIINLNS